MRPPPCWAPCSLAFASLRFGPDLRAHRLGGVWDLAPALQAVACNAAAQLVFGESRQVRLRLGPVDRALPDPPGQERQGRVPDSSFLGEDGRVLAQDTLRRRLPVPARRSDGTFALKPRPGPAGPVLGQQSETTREWQERGQGKSCCKGRKLSFKDLRLPSRPQPRHVLLILSPQLGRRTAARLGARSEMSAVGVRVRIKDTRILLVAVVDGTAAPRRRKVPRRLPALHRPGPRFNLCLSIFIDALLHSLHLV